MIIPMLYTSSIPVSPEGLGPPVGHRNLFGNVTDERSVLVTIKQLVVVLLLTCRLEQL